MKTIRDFAPADRYGYDMGLCSMANGFAQVDTSQDASYFGTWANPWTKTVVCYCEGDVTADISENAAEFIRYIRRIKQWNEDNGLRFLGIDPGLGGTGEAIAFQFTVLGLGDLLH